MKNKAFFGLVLLTIIILLGLVAVSTQNQSMTYNSKASAPETDLNSSDENTFGVNADDTMGPTSWYGNYSNTLPDFLKGNLTFYVIDPPGEPPGLMKKYSPTDLPKPTTEEHSQKITQSIGGPTSSATLPGKDAKLTSLLLTVNKVEVHKSGARPTPSVAPTGSVSRWETLDIGTTPKVIDLIDLANKKLDLLLGITKLEAGHYTEVRFYATSALAKYSDGSQVNLVILGKKKIVKIVKQFTINAGQTTKLTVDFDATRSVIKAGNKYLLKPVVARMIVE